ncbi:excinuclease ABC subunit UvrA [Pantoea sp. Mhis]|uniref:excinuclease ABC subunit UvrA n=1 Tax=Pantoea sp. Mhis TaxID=2576759 RepID=UPI00135CB183|nr:excinuclease ABC subunit UvrA [Pantoea sp. Mhis]MXP56769.1 excinuclease ABC subunit UvrA [Pantoea sp. Mhis]
MNKIKIRGARTHNLKNINVIIPRDKFIAITGLSGSGKSSLAFDTLYAESQRRYVESLSIYTRQYLSLMEKSDVDYIEGLTPSIAIKHKSILYNRRSTVGTITELYDYLRLLFARLGEPRCPNHNIVLSSQTISQMVDQILSLKEGCQLMLLSPLVKNQQGEYNEILKKLYIQGYIRVRIDNKIYELSNPPKLELKKEHTIEVVIDRFQVHHDISTRLAESLEIALKLSAGIAMVIDTQDINPTALFFSINFSCAICGYSIPKLEPNLFSFNNPSGACPTCNGLGIREYVDFSHMIHNPNISLADGAILGWDRHNFYYFQMLCSLAQSLKFDIETPLNQLNDKIRNIILYGSGQEKIPFKHINELGIDMISYHSFKGLLHEIAHLHDAKNFNVISNKSIKFNSNHICTSCNGTRLRQEACYIFIENTNLPDIMNMTIEKAMLFFRNLKLHNQRAKIAQQMIREIIHRLKFLIDVGLDYISISSSAENLSRGELQRIRLASRIGSGLVGVIYVIDEPSIGLHQRDNKRLITTLVHLRDLGNTVIVLEHDEDIIRSADYIIDMGPGAGVDGGKIVAKGDIHTIVRCSKSITGQYLSGKKNISVPRIRLKQNPFKILKLIGAHGNNLKHVTLTIPIGLFICITGVSGSGKSTLINHTLLPIAQFKLNGIQRIKPKPYLNITGLEHFDNVINIDQKSIGRTSLSNPATYMGIFTIIRELFANVSESRLRGYNSGRFSYNIQGGRCEACKGNGLIKVEMHFLSNMYVKCENCNGKRYNRETLEIKYKNKNIYEVLEMTVKNAHIFFKSIPTLSKKLLTLINVGLSYITLGHSTALCSTGEAQRLKLARELTKKNTNQTLYILDEPTTGLHFADIKQLVKIIYQLRHQGNTIIVVEHNLNLIKTADWIIDLGPEGGAKGGEILIAGTPENVSECKNSYTASFLKPILKN